MKKPLAPVFAEVKKREPHTLPDWNFLARKRTFEAFCFFLSHGRRPRKMDPEWFIANMRPVISTFRTSERVSVLLVIDDSQPS